MGRRRRDRIVDQGNLQPAEVVLGRDDDHVLDALAQARKRADKRGGDGEEKERERKTGRWGTGECKMAPARRDETKKSSGEIELP